MAQIKVSLLGRFCIQLGETEVQELESRKAEELLCYLLLYSQHPHSREQLSEILWGEGFSNQSKNYLRKALWQLQSGLDHLVGPEDAPLVLAEPEWIRVNPHCDVWVDATFLETAFQTVKGTPGRNLTAQQAGCLETAVEIYKGDLLSGCYQDWCLFERERLQFLLLACLDKLMEYCEKQQDYEGGITYGERVLRYDRAQERTHSRLMRLYYLAGDRTGALRQFERCKSALREDLDVEPGEATKQLYELIRQDILPQEQHGIEPPLLSSAESAALKTICTRLDTFQKTLGRLHTHLQEDLQLLERTMRRQ